MSDIYTGAPEPEEAAIDFQQEAPGGGSIYSGAAPVDGPGYVPPDPKQMAKMYSLAAEMNDPLEAVEKMYASMYMADRLGEPAGDVFKNFEHYSTIYMGKARPPKDALTSLRNEFQAGVVQQEISKAGYLMFQSPNETWEDYRKQIEKIQAKMPLPDNQDRGLLMRGLQGTLKLMPQIAEGMGDRLLWGAGTAAAAAPLIIAGARVPGPVDEVLSLGTAFGVGFKAGGWKAGIRLEGGMMMAEIATAQDEAGNYYSPEIVRAASFGYGVLAGAIETASFNGLMRGFPGLEKVVTKAAQKLGIGLAATKTFPSMIQQFTVKYGTNVAAESTQELAQESLQVVAETFATLVSNEMDETGFSVAEREEVKERLTQILKQSAETFAVMSIPGSVGGAYNATLGKADLTNEQRSIKNMVDNASPEQLNKLAEALRSGETESPVSEDIKAKIVEYDNEVDRLEGGLVELQAERENVMKEGGDVEAIDNQIAEHQQLIEQSKNDRADAYNDVPSWALTPDQEIERVSRGKPDIVNPNSPVRQYFAENLTNLTPKEIDATTLLVEMVAETKGMDPLAWAQNSFRWATEEETAEISAEARALGKRWGGATQWETVKQVTLDGETTEVSGSFAKLMNIWLKNGDESQIAQRIDSLLNEKESIVEQWSAQEWKMMERLKAYAEKGTLRENLEGDTTKLEAQARAIVAVSKRHDFSTFVHEMGHILRAQLDADAQVKAAKWAGAKMSEDGKIEWTQEAEERFAEGWEQYLRTGQAPTTALQEIFDVLKRWMDGAVRWMKAEQMLDEDIISVYDSLVSGEQSNVVSEGGGSLLYQMAAESDVEFTDGELEEIGAAYGSMKAYKEALKNALNSIRTPKGKRTKVRFGDKDFSEGESIIPIEKINRINVLGKTVSDEFDAANIFKLFRNPRIEMFHVAFTSETGEVLGHEVISSGLPGVASAKFRGDNRDHWAYLNERFETLGAAKIWIAHNHPSGEVHPSDADVGLTSSYHQNLGDRFAGHIISDHDKFTFMKLAENKAQWDVEIFRLDEPAKKYATDVSEQGSSYGIEQSFKKIFSDAKQPVNALAVMDHKLKLIGWAYVDKEATHADITRAMRTMGGRTVVYVTNDEEHFIESATKNQERAGTDKDIYSDLMLVDDKGKTLHTAQQLGLAGTGQWNFVAAEKAERFGPKRIVKNYSAQRTLFQSVFLADKLVQEEIDEALLAADDDLKSSLKELSDAPQGLRKKLREFTKERAKNRKIVLESMKTGNNFFMDKNGRKAIVHPSSREGYKYQTSYFDDKGPYTHHSSNWIGKEVNSYVESDVASDLAYQGFFPAEYKRTLFQSDEERIASLYKQAAGFDSLEEFIAYAYAMEDVGDLTKDEIIQVWESAEKERRKAPEVKREWSDADVWALIEDVAAARKDAAKIGFHGSILALAKGLSSRVRGGGGKQKTFDTAKKVLINNPELYNYKIAALYGDREWMESAQSILEEKRRRDERGDRRKEAERAQPKLALHRTAVEAAVKTGKPVPDNVLEHYSDLKWAQDEILRRIKQKKIDTELAEMASLAQNFEDFDEFRDFVRTRDGFPESKDRMGDEDFLMRVWTNAHGANSPLVNKLWMESLNTEQFLDLIDKNYNQVAAYIDPAMRWLSNEPGNENYQSVAAQIIGKNPIAYRYVEALVNDDKETLSKLAEALEVEELDRDYERYVDELNNVKPIESRLKLGRAIEDAEGRKTYILGQVTVNQLTDRISSLKEALASAKKEGKEELKLYKEKQAEIRRLKKLKAYAKKLGQRITKKVPDTVHLDYKIMIEGIAGGIDPNFRSAKTMATLEASREFFKLHPEAREGVPKKVLTRLEKKTLNELHVRELEDIDAFVKHLVKLGKTKRRLIVEGREREIEEDINSVIDAVSEGAGKELIKPDHPIAKNKQNIVKKAALAFLRPMRIADQLDGGKNFQGTVHNILIDRVNDAISKELEFAEARHEKIKAKMEELGVKEADLARPVFKIEDQIFSVDKVMDVYAKLKNERSRMALLYGNRIDENIAAQMISSLTEAEVALADAIVEEYGEHYDRLREAYVTLTNKDPGSEAFYTPMIRTDKYYDTTEEQILDEIAQRLGLRKAQIRNGFMSKRKDIPAEFQKEVRLGLYSTWNEMVWSQEHLINSAELLYKLNKTFKNDAVRQTIELAYGKEYNDEVMNYLGRFANPNIYSGAKPVHGLIRKARTNSAVAYLAFNFVTMGKQTVSYLYYLSETGPRHFFGALAKTMVNPLGVWNFAAESSPQMRHRAIERVIEELANSDNPGVMKIFDKVGKVGMRGIMWLDRITVAVGFQAVYDKYYEQTQDHEYSVQQALNATLRTQPAASATDIASAYADDGLLSIFLQFSNQLNQLWNMTTYDAPQAFKQKRYQAAFTTYLSVAIAGYVMYALSARRFGPEEPEDTGKYISQAMFQQMLNIVPLVGPVALQMAQGYESDLSVWKPVQAVVDVSDGIRQILDPEEELTEKELAWRLDSFAEGLAIAMKLPYIGPKRMLKATEALSRGESVEAVQNIFMGGTPREDK